MRTTPRRLIAVLALGLSIAPLAACGGDDSSDATTTTAGDGAASSKVTVHALDTLKFDEDSYTAKAGSIEVEYVNDGTLLHTLLIEDSDVLDLEVGGKDSATIDLEAGEYTLYCDVAGHEEAGMVATFIVE